MSGQDQKWKVVHDENPAWPRPREQSAAGCFAKAIGAIPVATVEGLAVKARAFAWWHYAGPDIPAFAKDDPVELLAHQIIAGLTRA